MSKLNRCPKCKGWMYLDCEGNTWEVTCLQCGYSRELHHNQITTKRNNRGIRERIQEPGMFSQVMVGGVQCPL
jgi:predicted nucleic-acid-binding Zn-ribbon protein